MQFSEHQLVCDGCACNGVVVVGECGRRGSQKGFQILVAMSVTGGVWA